MRGEGRPLRIGYLVQQFPPEVGAGPARVTEMATRWIERGAQVTVFTGMPNRPEGRIHPEYRGKLFVSEDWKGIVTRRSWLYVSPKPGFARTVLNNVTFMATSALQGVIRGGGLDVLIASSPPFFPHLSGDFVGRLRRIPLVLEVRDLWPDYLVGRGVLAVGGRGARALFAMERYLLGRGEAVTVVTESFRKRVEEKGVAPERVHVLPNGVDTTFYRPWDEPPPLPALAGGDGVFRVGYLGNFGAGQALSQVLDAAAILRREGVAARFVLVGDGPEREKLEKHAAVLGLENLSIHPPISKDQTRAFYNHCDLVLVPLAPIPVFQETIPSKLFEILACCRPVLACLDGEGRRIVEGSGGGWVVPPGEPESLAGAIRTVMAEDPGVLREMGLRGREYVGREYSRTAIADRYLDLLAEVAGHPKLAGLPTFAGPPEAAGHRDEAGHPDGSGQLEAAEAPRVPSGAAGMSDAAPEADG